MTSSNISIVPSHQAGPSVSRPSTIWTTTMTPTMTSLLRMMDRWSRGRDQLCPQKSLIYYRCCQSNRYRRRLTKTTTHATATLEEERVWVQCTTWHRERAGQGAKLAMLWARLESQQCQVTKTSNAVQRYTLLVARTVEATQEHELRPLGPSPTIVTSRHVWSQ